MTDYRDDWKYSKPIPRVEADRKYRENWDRVFGAKLRPMSDVEAPSNFSNIPWFSLSPDDELKKMRGP